MRANKRFYTILLLTYALTSSFFSVSVASNEPNAIELVKAVRESENWLHRIDSLQLRIEGKWTRPPESIAARYAELKKQYPDREPDPNHSWDLKPSESDMLEYNIDFKGKRLRYVKDTPGRSYFLGIWDGKQAIGYSDRLQQYYLKSTTKTFEKIFGSLSWPRAQPHSFWWEPQNVEKMMDYFGRAEDFKVIGRDEFHGVDCHVLEYTSRSNPPTTRRWYIGIKDHLLYGWKDWINPEFVFEYWTLDYKQIAPGCLLPMTQGYSMPSYNADTKQHYLRCVRNVRVVEARINEELPNELFEMKFEEGLTVIDERSGKTEVYNYRATPPSLVGKPLPDFENITIDLNPEQAKGRMLLLCFWDMNQRPSRHCLMQLSKKEQELKEKEVVVIAIQTSKVEQEKVDNWIKENKITFPVGIITDQEKQTRFNWGVKSLPWLILTDLDHIVIDEGFGLDDLDAKIKEIGPSKSIPADSNKVTGLVTDPNGKAVSGVCVTEFQTNKVYTTDADGKFISAFGPSDELRFFFAVYKQRKLVGNGRLSPGEKHVEIKLVPAKIVSGMVVDTDGKPVANAQVAPLPMTSFYVLTDKQGQFDVAWSPSWEPREALDLCLMVRRVDLNLTALADITEDTENIKIKLTPALTLTGIVEDPNGMPISGAKTSVSLIRGSWGCGTPVKEAITNHHGHFELYCLPQKQEYGVQAKAEGFWRNQIKTGIINRITEREKVGPIILKRPILTVSGIVVYANGKVVADIPVYLRGEGQPYLDTQTDSDGRFTFEKVCRGPIRISAKNDVFFGKIETVGGAKNVKLVVRPRFE